jgi:hypothetical protein
MRTSIFKTIGLTLFLFLFTNITTSQDSTTHGIVPLKARRAGQWFERVWGDPDVPGKPFVARIHADRGYIVLPHTHPIDENIVILEGIWAFAMGSRYDQAQLTSIEVGGFAFGPKNMPHFAWSKTESTIQVHGVGPFEVKLVDPAYDLTEKGTFLLTHLLRQGSATSSVPRTVFTGRSVLGSRGTREKEQ